jgi:hypothetical protein
MKLFKDSLGREWKLDGNFTSYGRVRDYTGVKLYDIATENRESLVQLTDPLTLGKVLWAMVEPQAEEAGITPEEFGEGFSGDAVTAAYDALIDEMVFFCHPRQRKLLEMALKKLRAVEERAEETVGEKIEEFGQEIDKAIDRWTRGFLDGSTPGSWESIPASGLSEGYLTPSEAAVESSGTTPVPS